ncbi:hydrogen peroxide-inducible genes activator [Sneathiella chinensis]|uniref:Transcriptional regulator n=1 Tax=Sneathiella chinensis TaxID=349750 RepID=A0ABQ5U2N4_9PROT|nr:hydrogen peroxide-inducible genes activator [Sneathiella chinensis]GLQ05941.1 transcriptional regulator [Sneathiella chinensis]
MISLKQLTYALAVEKTRHFKRAAELCNVSQSALSTAIAELENQLDLQIFERDNKKVLVTPLGEQVLEKARAIKLEVDDLYLLSRTRNTPLGYPMTIGVIPTIGPYLLPKVLPEVRRQYPNFKLSILEDQSHILVEKVRTGEIDTAILALPYAHDGLLAFEFWQEDFYVITHADDVKDGQTEITSKEMNAGRLLLLKDGHCLKDHALAACKLPPTEMDHSLAGTSLNTLVQMVAGRMGTTLVPQMALDQVLHESSDLKALHLNEPGPHRNLAFIIRPNYAGTANIELLMSLFTEQLEKHCLPHP